MLSGCPGWHRALWSKLGPFVHFLRECVWYLMSNGRKCTLSLTSHLYLPCDSSYPYNSRLHCPFWSQTTKCDQHYKLMNFVRDFSADKFVIYMSLSLHPYVWDIVVWFDMCTNHLSSCSFLYFWFTINVCFQSDVHPISCICLTPLKACCILFANTGKKPRVKNLKLV